MKFCGDLHEQRLEEDDAAHEGSLDLTLDAF